MFAPGLITNWARNAMLIALSAAALPSVCAAAGQGLAGSEVRSEHVSVPLRPSENNSVREALRPAPRRYSNERIRLLNLLLAVPLKFDQLTAEVSTLQVLEDRFNRRYGPNSVASRSVRDRLELLWAAMKSGRGPVIP